MNDARLSYISLIKDYVGPMLNSLGWSSEKGYNWQYIDEQSSNLLKIRIGKYYTVTPEVVDFHVVTSVEDATLLEARNARAQHMFENEQPYGEWHGNVFFSSLGEVRPYDDLSILSSMILDQIKENTERYIAMQIPIRRDYPNNEKSVCVQMPLICIGESKAFV